MVEEQRNVEKMTSGTLSYCCLQLAMLKPSCELIGHCPLVRLTVLCPSHIYSGAGSADQCCLLFLDEQNIQWASEFNRLNKEVTRQTIFQGLRVQKAAQQ
jgi:hypothetical protein